MSEIFPAISPNQIELQLVPLKISSAPKTIKNLLLAVESDAFHAKKEEGKREVTLAKSRKPSSLSHKLSMLKKKVAVILFPSKTKTSN